MHNFQPMAVEIHDERGVVARAVMRPESGCSVIRAAETQGLGMKSVDRRSVRRAEGKMKALIHTDRPGRV